MKLSVNLCGVKLESPTVLASGIVTTYPALIAASKSGVGAITTKSISPQPREGNPAPVVIRFDHGVMNSVGLRNSGIEKSKAEILEFLKKVDVPVIASIVSFHMKDFGPLTAEMVSIKPKILEVNLSCPNVDNEFGKPFATDAVSSEKAIKLVKKHSGKVPVFAKLSPNVANIVEIAKAVEAGGADGITAINSVGPGFLIDIKTRKARLGAKYGGVTGPAIFPVALRCVNEIYKNVKLPIIGMGGVMTAEDAIAMIMAGATVVGVGSALYYKGLKVFKEINEGLIDFMKKEKIKSLKEIRGCI